MQNIVFLVMVSLIIWRSTSKIHEVENVRRIGGKNAVEPLTFEKKKSWFQPSQLNHTKPSKHI